MDKKSSLIEEIDRMGEKIIAHRVETVNKANLKYRSLEEGTRLFYDEFWERYGSILVKTRTIHNACTQYTIDFGHGVLEIGLAITGLFSRIAGWSAYANSSFCLWTRDGTGKVNHRDPERMKALDDFLSNVNWHEIDKQVADQFNKLLRDYELKTEAMGNF